MNDWKFKKILTSSKIKIISIDLRISSRSVVTLLSKRDCKIFKTLNALVVHIKMYNEWLRRLCGKMHRLSRLFVLFFITQHIFLCTRIYFYTKHQNSFIALPFPQRINIYNKHNNNILYFVRMFFLRKIRTIHLHSFLSLYLSLYVCASSYTQAHK